MNSMDLKKQLSAPVQQLWAEVEAIAGQVVDIRYSENLGGVLRSVTSAGQPVIEYKAEKYLDDQGVAEELLHHKLRYKGFPRLRFRPLPRRDGLRIESTLQMLGDCAEHRIIYPILEAMGFSPRDGQAGAIRRQLGKVDWQDVSECAYTAPI